MKLAHKRPLVVDDEANVAAFVGDAASALGCMVDVAASSREAMELYFQAAPDVIVLVTGFHPHCADMAERLSTAPGLAPPVVLAKPVRLGSLLNTLEPLLGAA